MTTTENRFQKAQRLQREGKVQIIATGDRCDTALVKGDGQMPHLATVMYSYRVNDMFRVVGGTCSCEHFKHWEDEFYPANDGCSHYLAVIEEAKS